MEREKELLGRDWEGKEIKEERKNGCEGMEHREMKDINEGMEGRVRKG